MQIPCLGKLFFSNFHTKMNSANQIAGFFHEQCSEKIVSNFYAGIHVKDKGTLTGFFMYMVTDDFEPFS